MHQLNNIVLNSCLDRMYDKLSSLIMIQSYFAINYTSIEEVSFDN